MAHNTSPAHRQSGTQSSGDHQLEEGTGIEWLSGCEQEEQVRLRWPAVGDAPLWGAALLLWLLELQPDFQLQDICRRLLVEADLAGRSGECLHREGAVTLFVTSACSTSGIGGGEDDGSSGVTISGRLL